MIAQCAARIIHEAGDEGARNRGRGGIVGRAVGIGVARRQQIARIEPLRDNSLQLLLPGGREQCLAVVEGLRESHRPVAFVEELLEPLAALDERQVDQRLALDLEHVEDVVDERRPRLSLLHR